MADTILDIVRGTIGRRRIVARTEMRDLLRLMADRRLIEVESDWCQPIDGDYAAGWAAACTDLYCISVFADDASHQSRASSSNPGSVRYDMPGSLHPLHQATVMFAPATLPADSVRYLRGHARRVLLVQQPAGVPE